MKSLRTLLRLVSYAFNGLFAAISLAMAIVTLTTRTGGVAAATEMITVELTEPTAPRIVAVPAEIAVIIPVPLTLATAAPLSTLHTTTWPSMGAPSESFGIARARPSTASRTTSRSGPTVACSDTTRVGRRHV